MITFPTLAQAKLPTVAWERLDGTRSFAGKNVPESDGMIPRSTCECGMRRRKRDTTDRTLVTGQYLTSQHTTGNKHCTLYSVYWFD